MHASPLITYIERRKALAEAAMKLQPRARCLACKVPQQLCYCQDLSVLQLPIEFCILMHPNEERKTIATGRMTQRSLSGAKLWVGEKLEEDLSLQKFLSRPKIQPILLFPSQDSTELTEEKAAELMRASQRPLFILLDGTWRQARSLLRKNPNLGRYPHFHFKPDFLSGFGRVRKQPQLNCLSTIEAACQIIKICHAHPAAEIILKPFHQLVAKQEAFARERNQPRFIPKVKTGQGNAFR